MNEVVSFTHHPLVHKGSKWFIVHIDQYYQNEENFVFHLSKIMLSLQDEPCRTDAYPPEGK